MIADLDVDSAVPAAVAVLQTRSNGFPKEHVVVGVVVTASLRHDHHLRQDSVH